MFSYEGKVTIIRKYRGRVLGTQVFHNNGTPALFQELCRCLVKNSSEHYPKYLDLAEDGENASAETLLRAPLSPARDEVILDSGIYKAQKIFYLSYYDLKSTGSEKPLHFRLMSDATKSEEFAVVDLVDSNSDPIKEYKIADGESHEIIWEMSFENLSTGELEAGGGTQASSQSLESNDSAVSTTSVEQEVDS